MAVPAVPNRLEVVICCGYVAVRLLRLNIESRIAEVRSQVEAVIGMALHGTNGHGSFDFHLLFVRIRLLIVVYIPSERNPELVDEVFAYLRFLILRREIPPLVCFKGRYKLLDSRKC